MFAQIHFPQALAPQQLDDYLENGWFRMGQSIFTTNFLNFRNQFYSAVWLRIVLEGTDGYRKYTKIISRNAQFRITINRATITQQKEDLFAKYKRNVPFEASASLDQLLNGRGTHNIYNTFEIGIFDGDKLIALGYFDVGRISAAGISSFYDPDYKKHSLGKFLIHLKIDHCRRNKLRYFYPGYFAPGYPSFDYKLRLSDSMQFLQFATNTWVDIKQFSEAFIPYGIMRDKLVRLQALLQDAGIVCRLCRYEFFDANLIPDLNGLALFDFPLFLQCMLVEDEELNPMVIFDIRSDQYQFIRCRSIWPSKYINDAADDIYCSHLLKIEQCLHATSSAHAMVPAVVDKQRISM